MYVYNKCVKKKLQESDEKALKQKRDEKEYNVNRKSTVVLYIKEKAFLKTFTWAKNQKSFGYRERTNPNIFVGKPLHGPRIRST